MEQGSYGRKPIDFARYKVSKFVPHIYGGAVFGIHGCGSTALALLTGENPLDIPQREHWADRFMIAHLRERGFEVLKLTQRNVTNFEFANVYPITDDHVILACMKFRRGEASWAVIYNKMMFHNFEITTMETYELFNHPIITVYLVRHPLWDTRGKRKAALKKLRKFVFEKARKLGRKSR